MFKRFKRFISIISIIGLLLPSVALMDLVDLGKAYAADSPVVVNEFVSNPSSGNEWIELYNTSNLTVYISGWYLKDAVNNTFASAFPANTYIPAGAYYVIEDTNVLNNTGDTIKLFDSSDVQQNIITYGSPPAAPSQGKSAARIPDGSSTWQSEQIPTKGAANLNPDNIYVDDSNVSGVENGTSTNPYNTIAEGITNVNASGTVNVANGYYLENLIINKSLYLKGESANLVTVTGGHTVTANNVIIDNLKFVAASTVFTLDSSAAALDNISIVNSVFDLTTSPSIGIYLGGATPTNKLSNISMIGNSFFGPTNMICNPWKIGGSFGAPLSAEVDNITFQGNNVSKCSTPINLQNKNLKNIKIKDNIYRNTDGAVYIWTQDSSSPTGVLSNFTFTANEIDSTNTYGLAFFDTNVGSGNDADTLTDANFGTGNLVNSNKFVGIPGGYGLKSVSMHANLAAYKLDATNNWWGSDDPVFSNLVDGSVTTNPWWTTETGTPSQKATAPTLSDIYTNDTTPTLTWNTVTAYPAVDKYQVEINSTTITSPELTTKSYTLTTSLSEGTHTWKVKSQNAPNNYGWSDYSTSVNLIVDLTAPTGLIKINSGANYTTSKEVTLTLSATDTVGVDKMYFSTDGVNFSSGESYSTSKSYTLSGDDGTKTVYVKYSDKAGNVSEIYSASIILDTSTPSEPTLKLYPNDQTITQGDPFTVSGYTEPEYLVTIRIYSELVSTEYVTANENGYWEHVYTEDFAVGEHTITIVVTDKAGNSTSEKEIAKFEIVEKPATVELATTKTTTEKTTASSDEKLSEESNGETEITTVGPEEGEVKADETEEKQSTTRAIVTLAILIIAIGAAAGGYYGYQWWLQKDEVKKPKKPQKTGRW